MNRKRWLLLASLWVTGVAFAALSAGQKVFVKAKNTKVLRSAEFAAAAVDTLQPGELVVWQKKQTDQFHAVITPKGKKGFVYFANLSTQPPMVEYLRKTGDKPADPKAFATSGAATRALAPGPIAYGETKLDPTLGPLAVANVMAMEQLALSVTTDELQQFGEERALVLPLMVSDAKRGAK